MFHFYIGFIIYTLKIAYEKSRDSHRKRSNESKFL